MARQGGEAAKEAREAVERRTGRPVITLKNAVELNEVVTNLIEDIANYIEDK